MRAQLNTPPPQIHYNTQPRKANAGKIFGFIFFGLAGLFIIGMILTNAVHSPPTGSGLPAILATAHPLLEGSLAIPAGGGYTWTLTPNGSTYRVTGHFSVSGGTGNDIVGILATEDEYQNWVNGHQARVLWSTPGQVTAGQLDVALPRGRYILAFSNKFSLFTAKTLAGKIDVFY